MDELDFLENPQQVSPPPLLHLQFNEFNNKPPSPPLPPIGSDSHPPPQPSSSTSAQPQQQPQLPPPQLPQLQQQQQQSFVDETLARIFEVITSTPSSPLSSSSEEEEGLLESNAIDIALEMSNLYCPSSSIEDPVLGHFRDVLFESNGFLQNEIFCDSTLVASDGTQIRVHRLFLASVIPWLKDQDPTWIVLPDVDAPSLRALVSLMYTGLTVFKNRLELDHFLEFLRDLKVDESVITSDFITNHDENDDLEKETELPVRSLIRCACKTCYRIFRNTKDLEKHVEADGHLEQGPHYDPSTKLLSCPKCEKKYQLIYKFSVHLEKCCSTENSEYFPCPFCKKEFGGKSNLSRHIRIHTGDNPYTCDTCGRSFNQKNHLDVHRKIHSNEKGFSCEICNSEFRLKHNLKAHMTTHTEKPNSTTTTLEAGAIQIPKECRFCGKIFEGRDELKVHVKEEHSAVFSCDQCGRTFSNRCRLKDHLVTHSKNRDFECHICGSRFSLARILKEHLNIHSGSKPFQCQRCSKSFRTRSKLKAHSNVHTGEKKYSCQICGKGFISRFSMKRHARTLHEKDHNNKNGC